MLNLKALLDWIFELRYFHPDEVIEGRTAIPFYRSDGDPESKLVLVLGENAGGKSFFRRLIQLACNKRSKHKRFQVREIIPLSMEARSGDFTVRSLIYGDEARESTGECSARTVTTAIKTIQGRDHESILYWDEPDLGMSAAAAAGAGMAIKEFIDNSPELLQAVFLTTHSPAIVSQLLHCQHRPHYLYLGNEACPLSLEDWVKQQIDLVWSPALSPEQIMTMSRQRYLDINAILNDKKKRS